MTNLVSLASGCVQYTKKIGCFQRQSSVSLLYSNDRICLYMLNETWKDAQIPWRQVKRCVQVGESFRKQVVAPLRMIITVDKSWFRGGGSSSALPLAVRSTTNGSGNWPHHIVCWETQLWQLSREELVSQRENKHFWTRSFANWEKERERWAEEKRRGGRQ